MLIIPLKSADPLAQVITADRSPGPASSDMLVVAPEDAKEDYVFNGRTPAHGRKLPDKTAS
jgi:hypothetical protein